MAFLWVSLPTPAGNGVGADVDASALGSFKEIVVSGDFIASVSVEAVNAAGTRATTIATLTSPRKVQVPAPAARLRVRITGYQRGTFNVDVGAADTGVDAGSLAVPAGDGVGGAFDISLFEGSFFGFIVNGRFTGSLTVQASQDGSDFADVITMTRPGFYTAQIAAQSIRLKRSGVKVDAPGAPQVDFASGPSSGGGSGGAGGNTRDQAYDEGGPGAGRVLIADSGTPVNRRAGVGSGVGAAMELENPTDDGTQQNSPAYVLRGHVSDGLTIRDIAWAIQVVAQQGGELPSLGDVFRFLRSIDGGAWSELGALHQNGRVQFGAYGFTGVNPDQTRREIASGVVRDLVQSVLALEQSPAGVVANRQAGSRKVTLADAANIAVDARLGNVFDVTLGGDRTLDNPTGLIAGFTYMFIIRQDPTGGRTLSYGSAYLFPGGTAPTLSTDPGAVDLLSAVCIDDATPELAVVPSTGSDGNFQ